MPALAKSVKLLIDRASPTEPVAQRVHALEQLLELPVIPSAALPVARAAALGEPMALPSQHAVMKNNDALGAARWNLRFRGIGVLGRLTCCAEEAASALLSVGPGFESEVLGALGLLGHREDAVIAHLTRALHCNQVELRGTAAWALAQLGTPPEDLVAPLQVGLTSTDPLTRRLTVIQLGRLKTHAACAALVSAAADRKWETRAQAFESMRENGCACEAVRSTLVVHVRDRAELVRREASRTREALGVPLVPE